MILNAAKHRTHCDPEETEGLPIIFPFSPAGDGRCFALLNMTMARARPFRARAIARANLNSSNEVNSTRTRRAGARRSQRTSTPRSDRRNFLAKNLLRLPISQLSPLFLGPARVANRHM